MKITRRKALKIFGAVGALAALRPTISWAHIGNSLAGEIFAAAWLDEEIVALTQQSGSNRVTQLQVGAGRVTSILPISGLSTLPGGFGPLSLSVVGDDIWLTGRLEVGLEQPEPANGSWKLETPGGLLPPEVLAEDPPIQESTTDLPSAARITSNESAKAISSVEGWCFGATEKWFATQEVHYEDGDHQTRVVLRNMDQTVFAELSQPTIEPPALHASNQLAVVSVNDEGLLRTWSVTSDQFSENPSLKLSGIGAASVTGEALLVIDAVGEEAVVYELTKEGWSVKAHPLALGSAVTSVLGVSNGSQATWLGEQSGDILVLTYDPSKA